MHQEVDSVLAAGLEVQLGDHGAEVQDDVLGPAEADVSADEDSLALNLGEALLVIIGADGHTILVGLLDEPASVAGVAALLGITPVDAVVVDPAGLLPDVASTGHVRVNALASATFLASVAETIGTVAAEADRSRCPGGGRGDRSCRWRGWAGAAGRPSKA